MKERKDNEIAPGEECVGWGDKNDVREGIQEGDDKDDFIQLLAPAWAPFGHRQCLGSKNLFFTCLFKKQSISWIAS